MCPGVDLSLKRVITPFSALDNLRYSRLKVKKDHVPTRQLRVADGAVVNAARTPEVLSQLVEIEAKDIDPETAQDLEDHTDIAALLHKYS